MLLLRWCLSNKCVHSGWQSWQPEQPYRLPDDSSTASKIYPHQVHACKKWEMGNVMWQFVTPRQLLLLQQIQQHPLRDDSACVLVFPLTLVNNSALNCSSFNVAGRRYFASALAAAFDARRSRNKLENSQLQQGKTQGITLPSSVTNCVMPVYS